MNFKLIYASARLMIVSHELQSCSVSINDMLPQHLVTLSHLHHTRPLNDTSG